MAFLGLEREGSILNVETWKSGWIIFYENRISANFFIVIFFFFFNEASQTLKGARSQAEV